MSGWTVETLKEYYDGILAEKDKALIAALRSNEKALEILAMNYKQDKDNQNEWRATVNDIISKMGGSKTSLRELGAGIAATLAILIAVASLVIPLFR